MLRTVRKDNGLLLDFDAEERRVIGIMSDQMEEDDFVTSAEQIRVTLQKSRHGEVISLPECERLIGWLNDFKDHNRNFAGIAQRTAFVIEHQI